MDHYSKDDLWDMISSEPHSNYFEADRESEQRSAADKNRSIEIKEKSAPRECKTITRFSLQGMSAELEEQLVEEVCVIDRIALQGQWTNLYAKPNVGKTLITISELTKAVVEERVEPSMLFYINADDTQRGVVGKLKIFEEFGMHMIAVGLQEFETHTFLAILKAICDQEEAIGLVIVIDTLKKFVDLMSKRDARLFGKIARRFVSLGGTLIGLAHVNKRPGVDGKAVFAGTSDMVDACDCAYTIEAIGGEANSKIVRFENIKRRGDVADTAHFAYSTQSGISYDELFASVKVLSPEEVDTLQRKESVLADEEIISAIQSALNSGVNSKMKMASFATRTTDTSRRSAIRVIERYAGDDPEKHFWCYTVGPHNRHIYLLLDK